MKTNMGIIDRAIRIVIALIFVGLYFTNVVTGTLAIVLLVLAGVFTLTTLVGFCPLYWPFGINTQGKNK
ncbi:MAG: DUF2892 domain-containing protein [Paludibacter sp.]|nr:DUF2892 domain-containing protein [Paludibacter sp.]